MELKRYQTVKLIGTAKERVGVGYASFRMMDGNMAIVHAKGEDWRVKAENVRP